MVWCELKNMDMDIMDMDINEVHIRDPFAYPPSAPTREHESLINAFLITLFDIKLVSQVGNSLLHFTTLNYLADLGLLGVKFGLLERNKSTAVKKMKVFGRNVPVAQ